MDYVLITEGPHPGPTTSSLHREHVLVLPRPHYRGTTSWSYHVLTTEGPHPGPTTSSLRRDHILVLPRPHYRGTTPWSYHILTTEGPHPGPTTFSLQRDHILVLPCPHYRGTTYCTLGGVYGQAHLARICHGLFSHRRVFLKVDRFPLCPFRLF